MNETLKTIAERYSCRAYTAETLADGQLRAIADAALAAPSGVNRQPWRVIIVTNKALLDDMEAEAIRVLSEAEDKTAYNRTMERGGKVFYGAPCMVMIPIDNSPYAVMDCGILSQNVALAAASLGLGNVICAMARLAFAGDKAEEFKKRLGFPDGFAFGVAVLIGHAAATKPPHELDHAKLSYID